MSKLYLSLLTSILLALGSAQSEAQEALGDGFLDTNFQDVDIKQFTRVPGTESVAFKYPRPGSRYVRIVLKNVDLPPDTKLTIFGDDKSETFTLEGPFQSPEFFPPLVLGGSVEVTLSGKNPNAAKLSISKIIPQQTSASPWKSIFQNNELAKISTVSGDPTLFAAAASVVFLSFIDDSDDKVCSGFLLSDRTVMTNHHCVATQASCDTTAVLFDYISDEQDDISVGEQRRCKQVLLDNPALDFAVLELDRPVGPKYAPLALLDSKIESGRVTKLIQHPAGEWKQISEIGCEVLDVGVGSMDSATPTDLTHRCDTMGGSSGSPLLVAVPDGDTVRYCVGALHHWGFETQSMFFNTRNRAIQPQLIVASLKPTDVEFQTCN